MIKVVSGCFEVTFTTLELEKLRLSFTKRMFPSSNAHPVQTMHFKFARPG